ncbi:hypothetical protein CLV42_108176 [Chitinophaga ginsengisoli]|uniref:Uncharacterized protein n=2 Tax=Chitinophaga ginsengisoli TaxID=363837 RepID=A0A2P8G2S8_9BACT|nr:hypothetical protein CLV42_108176 [Chitinophaga ginsengisoli]
MENENLIAFEKRSGLFLNPLTIAVTILIFALGVWAMGNKFHFGMLVLPVLLVVILPGLAKKTLTSVVLDTVSGECVLVLNKWGRLHKRITIPVSDLRASYKDELSMKGMKRKVLRLFHEKQLIVAVFNGEGWHEDTLERIAASISELKSKS